MFWGEIRWGKRFQRYRNGEGLLFIQENQKSPQRREGVDESNG